MRQMYKYILKSFSTSREYVHLYREYVHVHSSRDNKKKTPQSLLPSVSLDKTFWQNASIK